MDEIVKQAMHKWPNVPACTGWLGLDARGHWYMRDAATQAIGPFPQAKGSLLQHQGLADFIGRNYACDAQGRWFFQNGPQRVFVELEAAPWVLRIQEQSLLTHTGRNVHFQHSLLDELGRAYILTECGLGLVHSQDVLALSDLIERNPHWEPENAHSATFETRFGFIRSPLNYAPERS